MMLILKPCRLCSSADPSSHVPPLPALPCELNVQFLFSPQRTETAYDINVTVLSVSDRFSHWCDYPRSLETHRDWCPDGFPCAHHCYTQRPRKSLGLHLFSLKISEVLNGTDISQKSWMSLLLFGQLVN